jgi:hypothetical protein
MSDEDPRITKMRDSTKRLLQLLDDPKPGLFTWGDFVRQRVNEIHEAWYGESAEQERRK